MSVLTTHRIHQDHYDSVSNSLIIFWDCVFTYLFFRDEQQTHKQAAGIKKKLPCRNNIWCHITRGWVGGGNKSYFLISYFIQNCRAVWIEWTEESMSVCEESAALETKSVENFSAERLRMIKNARGTHFLSRESELKDKSDKTHSWSGTWSSSELTHSIFKCKVQSMSPIVCRTRHVWVVSNSHSDICTTCCMLVASILELCLGEAQS